VPTAMEELRTKTQYQLADDPLSLPQIIAQEIVNRLSDLSQKERLSQVTFKKYRLY
jgi:hypothetical protein